MYTISLFKLGTIPKPGNLMSIRNCVCVCVFIESNDILFHMMLYISHWEFPAMIKSYYSICSIYECICDTAKSFNCNVTLNPKSIRLCKLRSQTIFSSQSNIELIFFCARSGYCRAFDGRMVQTNVSSVASWNVNESLKLSTEQKLCWGMKASNRNEISFKVYSHCPWGFQRIYKEAFGTFDSFHS